MNKIQLQAQHAGRWLSQRIRRPDIAIIGGYHGGNLGDMALGCTVAKAVERAGYTSGLQTIYNLHRWVKVDKAIVGGGGLMFDDCICKLVNRYGMSPQNISIMGVDFEDWVSFRKNAEFFDSVSYLSCRSRAQQSAANAILGKQKVQYHPDLVFGCGLNGVKVSNRSSLKVAINITPRFHLAEPQLICKDDILAEPVQFRILRESYAKACREVCQAALDKGFEMEHISFTPDDELIAKEILKGIKIKFIPYTSEVQVILNKLRDYQFCFPSRYHSLIFSLLSGVPCFPFAYADKSVRLLNDLDVDKARFSDLYDLLRPGQVVSKFEYALNEMQVLGQDGVTRFGKQVAQALKVSIDSLFASEA